MTIAEEIAEIESRSAVDDSESRALAKLVLGAVTTARKKGLVEGLTEVVMHVYAIGRVCERRGVSLAEFWDQATGEITSDPGRATNNETESTDRAARVDPEGTARP